MCVRVCRCLTLFVCECVCVCVCGSLYKHLGVGWQRTGKQFGHPIALWVCLPVDPQIPQYECIPTLFIHPFIPNSILEVYQILY